MEKRFRIYRNILFLLILAFLILLINSLFAAEIRLAWDPNGESDVVGYKIYFGAAPSTYDQPGNPMDVGHITTCTLTGLTAGLTYYITVTAYNRSYHESAFSNEVSGLAKEPLPYSLSISIHPSEGGSVTPSGTNWYPSGESVSLSATSSPGYQFSGWSGDLSDSTNSSTIILNGHKSVTANFTHVSEKENTNSNVKGGSEIEEEESHPGTINFNQENHQPPVKDRFEKPFIQLTSPVGSEVWLVGTKQSITWNLESSNPNGTIYLFYWYDRGWHPIAELPSGVTSYEWMVPEKPSELGSVAPGIGSLFSKAWVGYRVDGGWQCWDMSKKGFMILEDSWVFRVYGLDRGGVVLWFNQGTNKIRMEGYGLSSGLGLFRIEGEFWIDRGKWVRGTYVLYDFKNFANDLGRGLLNGRVDSNAERMVLSLKNANGELFFKMVGNRLFSEQVVFEGWGLSIDGDGKGEMDLKIEPYEVEGETYTHLYKISGTGSTVDHGTIDLEGCFIYTLGNRVYGIYEINGPFTEAGEISGRLNPNSEKLRLKFKTVEGRKYF